MQQPISTDHFYGQYLSDCKQHTKKEGGKTPTLRIMQATAETRTNPTNKMFDVNKCNVGDRLKRDIMRLGSLKGTANVRM